MNKSELIELAKSLGASDEVLKDKTNKELKVIIDELETEKESEVVKAPKEEDPEVEAKAEDKEDLEETTPVDSYTDDRGIVWEFKKSAPKTIRFDGRKMTQQEILADEALASELVYGNSNLLTKKI